MSDNTAAREPRGAQRLTVGRLERWRDLRYGMFLHFGPYTFTDDVQRRNLPASVFAPTDLDVEQWVQVAVEAGMKYMILTARHLLDGGFAMWPTKTTDFSVAAAAVKTDVVGAFVSACRKHGIRPALYLGGDDHNVPDGHVVNPAAPQLNHVSRAYMDLLEAQLQELLSDYGEIEEVWIDGPALLGPANRTELYNHISSLQPEAVVAMNGTWETSGRGAVVKPSAWPSDVLVIELDTPPIWGTGREDPSAWRELPWAPAGQPVERPLPYYMPTEVCTLANTGRQGWHWGPEARARRPRELLAMRLLCDQRNANCVLNVPPDRTGQIPREYIQALGEVQAAWRQLGLG